MNKRAIRLINVFMILTLVSIISAYSILRFYVIDKYEDPGYGGILLIIYLLGTGLIITIIASIIAGSKKKLNAKPILITIPILLIIILQIVIVLIIF